MPVSESRKKANQKWDSANLDRMSVALPKGSRERIKAFAEAKGESVNNFIRDAINTAIGGACGIKTEDSISLDYSAISEHIKKTGEQTGEFLARAVRDTIDRDNKMLQLGVKIR